MGEPHNKAKVKQADRIIVLLSLNKSGDDCFGQATTYWEDYITGSDSYKAMYSGLLAYKIDEEVSDQPGFVDSLRGRRMCDELIRLQDSARPSQTSRLISSPWLLDRIRKDLDLLPREAGISDAGHTLRRIVSP